MGSGDSQYSARFELPHLLEQRLESITCPVYRDGAVVTVAAGSIKLYNRSGIEVATEAMTFPGGVATVGILASTLDAESYGLGWWAEWSLTIASVVHLFRNDAALVRARLYPSITTIDLFRRLRSLDPSDSEVITRMSLTDYQAKLDEADIQIQLRLIEIDNRPGRIFSPSATRQTYLYLWIALVFEDLANFENVYQSTADSWMSRYEQAWEKMTLVYDADDDGQPSSDKRRSASHSVWLTSRQ
tara:strand:+ start:575 stop:1306 length:732 start_codon:yes stop_codon:yes gene_type:complete